MLRRIMRTLNDDIFNATAIFSKNMALSGNKIRKIHVLTLQPEWSHTQQRRILSDRQFFQVTTPTIQRKTPRDWNLVKKSVSPCFGNPEQWQDHWNVRWINERVLPFDVNGHCFARIKRNSRIPVRHLVSPQMHSKCPDVLFSNHLVS